MRRFLMVSFISFITSTSFAQKIVSELTINYDITVESSSDNPRIETMFNGATTTVYLKQSSHRTDQVNGLGSTATIFDGKSNTGAIIKEFGKQKILIKMTAANFVDMNKKNTPINFIATTETKEIAGYNCTKYTGLLSDSATYEVYVTTAIVPENKDYNTNFKGINGLVLQYEITTGTGTNKVKIINTASKVSTTTVAPTKFELPKTGYRVMTYEESVKK